MAATLWEQLKAKNWPARWQQPPCCFWRDQRANRHRQRVNLLEQTAPGGGASALVCVLGDKVYYQGNTGPLLQTYRNRLHDKLWKSRSLQPAAQTSSAINIYHQKKKHQNNHDLRTHTICNTNAVSQDLGKKNK